MQLPMTVRQAQAAISAWKPTLDYRREFPRVATLMREHYVNYSSFVEPAPMDLGPGPVDTTGD